MRKITSTSSDQWTLWIEPQLSLFVFAVSLPCCQCHRPLTVFPCSGDRTLHWPKFAFIAHCTRMCHLVVSAVLDLFDTSIHFFSFLISLITLLFLLPDTFNFHDVEDKYPAYFRWGPWHLGRERASHWLWAQRPLHHRGICRIHPGVLGRATVPWWLQLRWRHHRQDAPWRVPKTSLWRRRPVVLSVVVSHDRTVRPVVCRNSETTRKVNRLGLSWSDKESRFSLTAKKWFENTNSKLITTEEVFRSWTKRSSRKKKKFVVLLKETNDVD